MVQIGLERFLIREDFVPAGKVGKPVRSVGLWRWLPHITSGPPDVNLLTGASDTGSDGDPSTCMGLMDCYFHPLPLVIVEPPDVLVGDSVLLFLISTLLSSVPVVVYLVISFPSLKSSYSTPHLLATESKKGHMPDSNLEKSN